MRRPLRAALAVALAALGACVTGANLRESAGAVRADVERARRSGAVRCAPKELATAEANLDFADVERGDGRAGRAREHLDAAAASARKALELTRTCAPTQVVIGKGVRIEKVDRDGDGVPDVDDACPDVPGRPEARGCPDADGDGVPDAEDACPNDPGPRETQGCPVAKDTDGDGIPDDIDRCPLDPEDLDGFQDEDGCPDADNDGDGVVDKADACPNMPGPIENRGCPLLDRDGDGVPDAEDRCPDLPGPKEQGGCPDRDGDGVPDRADRCPDQFGPPPDGCPKKYTLVQVNREKIAIRQQVLFATARFRVLPASFKLLNQVVQVLKDFPKMRVSIEGHTDNVGAEAANTRLSQRRAEAVRDYLVSRGVAPARLEAIGYGPAKPIASNKTAKGKSRNRRTEFRILSLE